MNIKKNLQAWKTTSAAIISLALLVAGWTHNLPFEIPETFQYILGAVALIGWILPNRLKDFVEKKTDLND